MARANGVVVKSALLLTFDPGLLDKVAEEWSPGRW